MREYNVRIMPGNKILRMTKIILAQKILQNQPEIVVSDVDVIFFHLLSSYLCQLFVVNPCAYHTVCSLNPVKQLINLAMVNG